MNVVLVAPLLAVIVGLLAAWYLPSVATPATCLRVLSAAAVIAAGGVTSALVLVLLAALSEVDTISQLIGWCRALYPGDHGATPIAGMIAAAALGLGAISAVRHRQRRRADLAAFGHLDGVHVVATGEPVAFAVPGRPGGVVIGASLLEALEPIERRVVLAHEQAHLDCRHHRYVGAAELCAAAYPFLAPIARQVRFNAERCADEIAATRVGSRTSVARAIAKTALAAGAPPSAALAFRGPDTVARVDALVHPRTPLGAPIPFGASAATVLVTLTGATLQLHHLASFVLHACQS